eukprot:Platyproteum_vivax@DN2878_c0_g1_i1.p1
MPDQPGNRFSDAGRISFSEGSRVDTAHSVGYRAGKMFCVAPIMDGSESSPIHYWAAGVDCCGEAGGFRCDSSGDEKAIGGIVLNALDIQKSRILLFGEGSLLTPFRKAIAKAAATYKIKAASDPIIVKWLRHPTRYIMSYWAYGLSICILSSALFFLVVLIVGGINQLYLKRSAESYSDVV